MAKMLVMAKSAQSIAYDVLFAEAVTALHRHNPCRWENGTCIAMRAGQEGPQACCQGCGHLTDQGCSVEAITCKVWLCDYVRQQPENQVIATILDTLNMAARKLLNTSMYCSRQSKQELGL